MSLVMFMMFFSAILIFGAAELALVHSEKLYARFLPPTTSPIPDNDNSLNQDCSQTATGKEISQSLECQQKRDNNDNDYDSNICPLGYYRNSFGYCVPLLQISP